MPKLGAIVETFFNELVAGGVSPSAYHLPDWTETPEGLRERLDQLFRTTPPTAMIVDDAFVYLITYQYLLQRGIRCPERVSMICCDPHPMFEWMRPMVSHIDWNADPLVKNVLRWVNELAAGKIDLKQHTVNASLVEGETIGPAREQ